MTTAQVQTFGQIDGATISQITLRSRAGAEAKILTWGAVIRDLVVPARQGSRRVVLGLDTIEDYKAHSPHFGAVPGRFANRIAGGRFTLEGRAYDLPRNDHGVNTLHGGPHGFSKRPWVLGDCSDTSVTLTLRSENGDEGFPGTLEATCIYTLVEPATLRFELSAVTDKTTVVNLTNHSYFNLDGSPDILDHEVTIVAEAITPTDATLIPTGQIAPVAGTAFDFRLPRTVRNTAGQTYDINYVLSGAVGPDGLRHAATVHSPRSGVTLQVHTDQPGVQFYDASKLNCPVPGLGGATYRQHGALCLEAQNFPDAPNQPTFPSSVLRPGERYAHSTEFRFA